MAINLQKLLLEQGLVTQRQHTDTSTDFIKVYNLFINQINKFAKGKINRIDPSVVEKLKRLHYYPRSDTNNSEKFKEFLHNYNEVMQYENSVWISLPENHARQTAYIGISIGTVSIILAFIAAILCLTLISNPLIAHALYFSLALGLIDILLVPTAICVSLCDPKNQDLILENNPEYKGQDNWVNIEQIKIPIQQTQHTHSHSLFQKKPVVVGVENTVSNIIGDSSL